jgi:hypothetical protein
MDFNGWLISKLQRERLGDVITSGRGDVDTGRPSPKNCLVVPVRDLRVRVIPGVNLSDDNGCRW